MIRTTFINTTLKLSVMPMLSVMFRRPSRTTDKPGFLKPGKKDCKSFLSTSRMPFGTPGEATQTLTDINQL